MPGNPVYSSTRWRKLRLKVIAAQPVCAACHKMPSTVVDHIIAHKGDDALMWGWDNLRGCCKRCHDIKTATQDNPHAFGRWKRIPDFIDPPRMPVTLVCGAPGSGRTAYAQGKCGPNDIVIDPAVIASRLSGEDLHRSDMSKWITPTMLERNRQLGLLASSRYERAWVVIAGERAGDRRAWRELLNCDVVVLETSIFTCEENVRHSPRWDKKGDIKAAKRWWKNYCADSCDTVVFRS